MVIFPFHFATTWLRNINVNHFLTIKVETKYPGCLLGKFSLLQNKKHKKKKNMLFFHLKIIKAYVMPL